MYMGLCTCPGQTREGTSLLNMNELEVIYEQEVKAEA